MRAAPFTSQSARKWSRDIFAQPLNSSAKGTQTFPFLLLVNCFKEKKDHVLKCDHIAK